MNTKTEIKIGSIIKIINTNSNRLGLLVLIYLSRLVARNGRSRRKIEDVQMMCGWGIVYLKDVWVLRNNWEWEQKLKWSSEIGIG